MTDRRASRLETKGPRPLIVAHASSRRAARRRYELILFDLKRDQSGHAGQAAVPTATRPNDAKSVTPRIGGMPRSAQFPSDFIASNLLPRTAQLRRADATITAARARQKASGRGTQQDRLWKQHEGPLAIPLRPVRQIRAVFEKSISAEDLPRCT